MSSNHFFEGFELPQCGEESHGLIIPRSFFERVVITEPASTIRVVAFILLRTLAGQTEVEASYTDFVRELRLCRQSVQEGLARAMEAGYIRLVQSGENGHIKSRYAICWATSSSSPPPPSPPPSGGGGNSTNHHGSISSTTSTTSTLPTISTLTVRKNQNATRQPSTHHPINQTTEEKQTGNISRIIPSPVAVAGDSNSNKSSKVTSVSNKVSMLNRKVESLVESGVPARKADQHAQQQQDFYHSTFPSTTTSPTAIAATPNSTLPIPPWSYYCRDSLAAASFPVYDTAAPLSPTKPALSISSYLSHLSSDISREFADISHRSSNRTQTHNLWHHSHLTEAEFAQLMYQARELTRCHAVLRPGEVPPPGQGRNRMPYFFACLRDLLGLRGEESKSRRNRRSSSSSLNDQAINAHHSHASTASLFEDACWQAEEDRQHAEERPASSAYSTNSKLHYRSGSQWREAQSFNAEAETDSDSTIARRSGYALADSPLSTSSGATTAVLLPFPSRGPRATRPDARTIMADHSPGFNHSNGYWNYQRAEEEGGNSEEDEVREFTTDHTPLEIVPNFKQVDASNSADNRTVSGPPLFGGAEARSRERYLARYGPRGFPGSKKVDQERTNTSSSI